ncbi:recombinase RecA, partial [Staphylococcus aureus]|nr:recombinase RecA [Staphylococcus aureus]
PYIDEINISKNKSLAGIYFKNEPLNIVKQTMELSIV